MFQATACALRKAQSAIQEFSHEKPIQRGISGIGDTDAGVILTFWWLMRLRLQEKCKRGVVDEFRSHGLVQVAWGGQSDGRRQHPHSCGNEGISLAR